MGAIKASEPLLPPPSVRRAAAVLIDWGLSDEMLSAGREAVARGADDLFGNGSAGLRKAEVTAETAFLAILRSLANPVPPEPIAHNGKAGLGRPVAAGETSPVLGAKAALRSAVCSKAAQEPR